ncbi:S1C family serine protease [Planctomycetes bacterium K23_9]|uniref:Serine protease HtrA n=1 Tax=Stieleria marina TaxID=1930275 RepID=A0A517NX06_9BACT|nr:Putative serine protease HtrA [Planctomycetes bacterium K23_9]
MTRRFLSVIHLSKSNTLALAFGAVCCLISLGNSPSAISDEPDASPTKPVAAEPVQADAVPAEEIVAEVQAGPRALSRAFRAAARKATPSVVTVFSYGQEKINTFPAPVETEDTKKPDEKTMTGIGSGVIVGNEGLVITNNHVISGAKRVVVQLSDESEIEASVVRGDPDSDVAMLRIQRDTPFTGADVGNSDDLEVGDWVLAIGSPFRLEATVSAGIISAKNRPIERIRRGRMLQTDAAINPGNSGGPLIDLDGNVIGISTAIATRNGGYQGIGFAIPINHAKWIADELDQHEKVRRAAIGATLLELKPKYAKMFKKKAFQGVLIYQVIEDSVADVAGFKQLDVIVEFAGERVKSPETLQEVIERKPVGSMQAVKIDRNGDELTLQVELATVDDPTPRKATEEAMAAETREDDAKEVKQDAQTEAKPEKADSE